MASGVTMQRQGKNWMYRTSALIIFLLVSSPARAEHKWFSQKVICRSPSFQGTGQADCPVPSSGRIDRTVFHT